MSRRQSGRNQRQGRSQQKQVSLWQRIFRNRYNPGSNWVSLGDVVENIRTTWYAWVERVPPGSRLIYRNGRVVGHSSTWPGRR
jgi:hypothetical protein